MKVKIIFMPALINLYEFEQWNSPPVSIYLLATLATRMGIDASVIDPCQFFRFGFKEDIYGECGRYILEMISDMDIVAFSSNTFNWGITKKMIEYVRKEYPHIPIILGGLHPTIFSQYILETTGVTYILRGEGEVTFPFLLSKIKNQEEIGDVMGLSFKKEGKIFHNPDARLLSQEKLTSCPSPDFALIPRQNTYTTIPIEASRGCPFCCCFCSIPRRKHWIGFEPDVVIKRVEDTVHSFEKIKTNGYINFVDDCFTVNGNRAKMILNTLYEKYKGDKKIYIEARISNIIESDIFQTINPDVLNGIQIGVEAGYDEGLRRINKKLTIKQLFMGLDILKEYGYNEKCLLSFIIGFPWESETEINMTLKTIEKIGENYNVRCSLNWLIYLPSSLWRKRKEDGIFVDEDIYDDPLWLNDEKLFFKLHPQIDMEIVNRVTRKVTYLWDKGFHISYAAPFLKMEDL